MKELIVEDGSGVKDTCERQLEREETRVPPGSAISQTGSNVSLYTATRPPAPCSHTHTHPAAMSDIATRSLFAVVAGLGLMRQTSILYEYQPPLPAIKRSIARPRFLSCCLLALSSSEITTRPSDGTRITPTPSSHDPLQVRQASPMLGPLFMADWQLYCETFSPLPPHASYLERLTYAETSRSLPPSFYSWPTLRHQSSSPRTR